MSLGIDRRCVLGGSAAGDSGSLGIVSSTIFLGLAAAREPSGFHREREPGAKFATCCSQFCPGSPFLKPVHGAEASVEGKP